MEAVNYNNLAFCHSSDSFVGVNLELAEQYLHELTKRIPETDWDPNYAEFFHTKGCVLLAKFRAVEDVAIILEAYKAAMKAFELFPEKPEHRELKETIEDLCSELTIRLPES